MFKLNVYPLSFRVNKVLTKILQRVTHYYM